MRRLMLLVAAVAVVVALASTAPGSVGSGRARWVITDLGALGGTWSEAVAINERGQVVGDPAFLWQSGRIRRLVPLAAGADTNAIALNDRGQVVGNIDTTEDELRSPSVLLGHARCRWASPPFALEALADRSHGVAC
jgi:uncharacterized membrane protein